MCVSVHVLCPCGNVPGALVPKAASHTVCRIRRFSIWGKQEMDNSSKFNIFLLEPDRYGFWGGGQDSRYRCRYQTVMTKKCNRGLNILV